MLWVDRVGDRRSQAILARYFAENNLDRHNNDENEQARTGFTRATERRNNDKKGNETMLKMNRPP